jgi:hypothetical protein
MRLSAFFSDLPSRRWYTNPTIITFRGTFAGAYCFSLFTSEVDPICVVAMVDFCASLAKERTNQSSTSNGTKQAASEVPL